MALDVSITQRAPALPLLRQLDIRTLAVFRALQLGDMLCAVPALRALRAALPQARITIVGLPWAEQFARRFDCYIDDFIPFPGHPDLPEQAAQGHLLPEFYEAVRARGFDLALQMHGSGEVSNGIVHAFGPGVLAGFARQSQYPGHFLPYPDTGPEPLRLLQLVEFLGASPVGADLEFPLHEQDAHELRQSGLHAGLAQGEYICIHPGARIRTKCWAPRLFAQVADQLARESGLTIVLTGSEKEFDLTSAVAAHMQTRAVNAAAPISIGAMAALMRGARLLVCNDTGVSHIAAGLKLPSVVIFTSTDMRRWAPLDHALHRCVRDPEGTQIETVLHEARALLAAPN